MGGPWRRGWGAQDDAESIATLQAAVDAGVNWIDTAPVYGAGHAEEVVGRALARHDDVLIFTKCGLFQGRVGLSPASIRRECEASLRRLRRESIDLYQLHWQDPSVPLEATCEALV